MRRKSFQTPSSALLRSSAVLLLLAGCRGADVGTVTPQDVPDVDDSTDTNIEMDTDTDTGVDAAAESDTGLNPGVHAPVVLEYPIRWFAT